ncbi:MAG TPA: isoprenylcysteine carboxylmethyltransferase family protein [Balneolales bacterium]|nr:isoprenylcysteine carboxylmethyltransferase family protein [Balneolales bacterium]
MLDWLFAIVGFAVFATIHSLLASHTLKKKLFSRFPALSVWYRISYNLISLVLLVTWAVFLPVSHRVIYRIAYPYVIITSLIQLAALLAGWKTVQLFGSGRFLGTEQLRRYISHHEIPEYYDENSRGIFIQKGLYRYIRHPLYTLSLIILICWPVMTTWFATIVILCALYFWIGSIYEEQKLVKRFGSTYEEYQKRVPRMIPYRKHPLSA